MKKVSFVLFAAMLPCVSFADEANSADAGSLVLSVRRIGLELSQTQVRHAVEYKDSPISALNADSQDFIKGVFDTALEYKKNRFQWDR